MQRVRIKKTADYTTLGKGHAVISVMGQGLPLEKVNLYIQRSGYSDSELGPAGWQATEFAQSPMEVHAVDDGMEYVVGPEVVGYLERGNYQLMIGSADSNVRVAGVMTWRNVTPCSPPAAQGRTGGVVYGKGSEKIGSTREDDSQPIDDPDTPVSDPETEKTVVKPPLPTPAEEPPVAGRPGWLIPAIAVAVILIAALGGFLLFGRSESPPATTSISTKDSTPNPPEVIVEEPPKTKPGPNVPVEKPSSKHDWRQYVDATAEEQFDAGKTLLRQGIDTGARDLIDQAERLFDMAGAQGHAEALRQRAMLFDPRELTTDRVGQLDVSIQSAYNLYRRALEAGSEAAKRDLEGLKSAVVQLAEDGDGAAVRVLRRWKD